MCFFPFVGCVEMALGWVIFFFFIDQFFTALPLSMSSRCLLLKATSMHLVNNLNLSHIKVIFFGKG